MLSYFVLFNVYFVTTHAGVIPEGTTKTPVILGKFIE